jgi:hypothetical protein
MSNRQVVAQPLALIARVLPLLLLAVAPSFSFVDIGTIGDSNTKSAGYPDRLQAMPRRRCTGSA